ncbi:MAG TPA: ArsC/Spx/MgsR family protein [Acidimicrobiales bacterium]|nr:ArsC/Spx/MgsR family protein [Acidimicrobiales bacterium]
MAVAETQNVEAEVVLYMKTPPDRATLEQIVSVLEDPVEDLVRKDSKFKELGLSPDDYVANPQAVINLLVERKALMQRPVLVKSDRAIIGRPKDRIAEFLA